MASAEHTHEAASRLIELAQQPQGPPPVILMPPQPGMPYHGPDGGAFPGGAIPAALSKPKRQQVKQACTNCAAVSKRCDNGRPCQRCIKVNTPESCVNGVRKERAKGVKRGPYRNARSRALEREAEGETSGGRNSQSPAAESSAQSPDPSQQPIPGQPPFFPYFYGPPDGSAPGGPPPPHMQHPPPGHPGVPGPPGPDGQPQYYFMHPPPGYPPFPFPPGGGPPPPGHPGHPGGPPPNPADPNAPPFPPFPYPYPMMGMPPGGPMPPGMVPPPGPPNGFPPGTFPANVFLTQEGAPYTYPPPAPPGQQPLAEGVVKEEEKQEEVPVASIEETEHLAEQEGEDRGEEEEEDELEGEREQTLPPAKRKRTSNARADAGPSDDSGLRRSKRSRGGE